jgi:hypothetical protein
VTEASRVLVARPERHHASELQEELERGRELSFDQALALAESATAILADTADGPGIFRQAK